MTTDTTPSTASGTPAPASTGRDENLALVIARLEQIRDAGAQDDTREMAEQALVCACAVAAKQPAPATGGELPKLDDDDEVVFPNDSGLAVIHESYYWKLRGYEEACARGELDVEAERREFEAEYRKMLRNPDLQCFDTNTDGDYVSAILFSAWRLWLVRARRTATGTPAKSAPGEAETREGRCRIIRDSGDKKLIADVQAGRVSLKAAVEKVLSSPSPSNSPVGAKDQDK